MARPAEARRVLLVRVVRFEAVFQGFLMGRDVHTVAMYQAMLNRYRSDLHWMWGTLSEIAAWSRISPDEQRASNEATAHRLRNKTSIPITSDRAASYEKL